MDARSWGKELVRLAAVERHPLLWSAVTSVVLFVVVGMTADASHAWGSHPALS